MILHTPPIDNDGKKCSSGYIVQLVCWLACGKRFKTIGDKHVRVQWSTKVGHVPRTCKHPIDCGPRRRIMNGRHAVAEDYVRSIR